MAANVFADIKEYLGEQPAVVEAVGSRIYNGRAPRNAIKASARRVAPYLELRGVGGLMSDDISPFGQGRIDVYVFANDFDDAQVVDLLVYTELDRMNGYGSINYVDPSGWTFTVEENERRGVFRSYIIHTFRHGRSRIGE